MKQTIKEINRKIKTGKAVVVSADELKHELKTGKGILRDVDVVTTATFGVMSGVAALISLPLKKVFEKAEGVWLNGVPAFPGPCPNERLGIVECIVYGSSPSLDLPKRYGGGHLLQDLAAGKEIEVAVKTENNLLRKRINLAGLEFARLFTTRSCIKNYCAFINPRPGTIQTIFSVTGLSGPYKEISVSGCGDMNPLQNDPTLKTIGVGTRILVNGAIGYITGRGTRSTRKKPNLSVCADLKGMLPELMGGFITSKGPECLVSIAIPVPVLSDEIAKGLTVLDEEIPLPIVDIRHRRKVVAVSNYGEVWQKADLEIACHSERCLQENVCRVETHCPTNAYLKRKGIERAKCMNCGLCIFLCPGKVFTGNLSGIEISGREVPVTLRQSSKLKAVKLAHHLKNLIEEGQFLLTEPSSGI